MPKDPSAFSGKDVKDSKKFSSKKKLNEVAAYIKEKALGWAVAYADERVIDAINIRNATHQAMHDAIKQVLAKQTKKNENVILLVDGNDFTPFIPADATPVSHVCIEGGDNAYSCIAAASILAKVARDDYIVELCAQEPDLIARYDLVKNKGYGTKKHMDGIREYGITQWHRKSFAPCKVANITQIE